MLFTFVFSSLLYLWYIIQNTDTWKWFIISSMIFFKIDCGSKSRLILVFCVNGLCYHYITLSFMSVIISHFWDLFVFFSLVFKNIYIFAETMKKWEKLLGEKKKPKYAAWILYSAFNLILLLSTWLGNGQFIVFSTLLVHATFFIIPLTALFFQ